MTFAVAAAYDNTSLAGASQRGPIPDATVHAVAAMIDNTGAVAQIARWRDDDTHGSHPGGRPSALDDRAVLTVWVLLAIEHSPLFVDRAADLIANRLSPAALNSLGVRHHPSSVDDCYGRCWRATHRLLDVIEDNHEMGLTILSGLAREMIDVQRRLRDEGARRLDWSWMPSREAADEGAVEVAPAPML